jgi:hypothetical protein
MGTRFGGHLAFPLFARFQSTEEAEQYCKTKLEPLKILDQTVCILWESKFGKDLIDTFVLSPKVPIFVILTTD